ncbi:ras-related protein Rab-40B-like [Dermacentor silvarum]|uniref:ras-related protein Rab-40B-like n=1 Tax=Dermacentor silvarum TaxID=543639 RepID=UPI00189C013A|nr:ras-related protein Rab-40B-like [Dermacentor silvarum]
MDGALNGVPAAANGPVVGQGSAAKAYDYLLKFLLVGDSDVGKGEILGGLEDGALESPFSAPGGFASYRTTTVLLDGKRVRLHLWDTSGQGRFSTIIRSYSRGAQGILLVYDITNRWSFDGLGRWLQEVERHAPGVSKVLLGNRLHLAFNREVGRQEAAEYAHKHGMAFFEVSPLCDFNVTESFVELSRMALRRNGMKHLWRSNRVLSLQELCCRSIVSCTSSHRIEQLPLPTPLKSCLKSYFMSSSLVDGSSSRPGLPLVPSHPVGARGAELKLNGRNKHHRRHSACGRTPLPQELLHLVAEAS